MKYFPEKNHIMQRGYTLVEVLLYISITVILLGVLSLFLITFLEARVKNQTISEVDSQGVQVMQIITQSIRNAQSINSPNTGNDGGSISLESADTDIDPIEFYLSSGVIEMTEDNGTAIPLTNNRVVASDLLFENLSIGDTSGIVRTSFVITHNNPSGRNEYSYTKTVQGSASLRGGTATVTPSPPVAP
jgi:Tfp pilus assembly protein PilW